MNTPVTPNASQWADTNYPLGSGIETLTSRRFASRASKRENQSQQQSAVLWVFLLVGILLGGQMAKAQTSSPVPVNQIAALTTTVINTTAVSTALSPVARFTNAQLNMDKATVVDEQGNPVPSVSIQKTQSMLYGQLRTTGIAIDFINLPVGVYYIKSVMSSSIASLNGKPIYYRIDVVTK